MKPEHTRQYWKEKALASGMSEWQATIAATIAIAQARQMDLDKEFMSRLGKSEAGSTPAACKLSVFDSEGE